MRIVGFTAELKELKGRVANVGVRREERTENPLLIAIAFEAILKCMKETNREAFYIAMSEFVDDNEFDDALKFIEEVENE